MQIAGEVDRIDRRGPQLEVVGNRLRGQSRGLPKIARDVALEDTNLEIGLDADDNGRAQGDEDCEADPQRQRVAAFRPGGALVRRFRGRGLCGRKRRSHCSRML